MKSNKTLLFTALIAILFSSCGSLSIGTKRYSRGLNISWFSGKDEVKKHSNKDPEKRKTELALKDDKQSLSEANNVDESAYSELNLTNTQDVIQTKTLQKIEASKKVSKNSELKSAKQESRTETSNKSLIKKINKKIEKMSPKSSTETHESSGLDVIGWILIILGLIFLLLVSIALGVILLLLGLLFVVVG
ncbi:MAG TPA: hypothetical protein VGF79_15610, partial [Bacteroidia bacterium]